MWKTEPVCHKGYLVGLLFREISLKREEQNNRTDNGVLIVIDIYGVDLYAQYNCGALETDQKFIPFCYNFFRSVKQISGLSV